ncbi:MAG: fibrobacter succinogenes major paralogous domain-containing protein [Fibromonadaceae bacterium]|jgi:uncharacterized protein (TIGR02145 family)|nr:fibrobacter succinogenes major paralogous domain-containing protein [Fibromonadaceae bacterium]
MLRFYFLLALPASLFLGCGSYDEVNTFSAEKCGKDYYNLNTQFCYDAKIYDKCGGNRYDPLYEKCKNNNLFSMCGNDYYNQTTQFCQNSKIYNKCGGMSYDPLNQKCENNNLFSKCGNDYYNQSTQFCLDAKIYDKCGGSSYDPFNQKCENDNVFSKCGNEWYNPSSQACINNVVGNKEEFKDSRDDKTYKYVKIGTQTWMAENLQYETSNTKCYNDNPDNCKIFGILYDWNTAKKVCPAGWHLPNDEEWVRLGDYAGDNAAKLKANSSFWEFSKGTDDFGFTALPGGFYRGDNGGFRYYGECACFWSATEGRISGSAHMRYLNNYSFGLDGNYIHNSWVNVRCIKDI